MKKAYEILLWNWKYNLKAQLEDSPSFRQIKRYSDVLVLIKVIKGQVFKFEYQKKIGFSQYMGSNAFYGFYQQNDVREDYYPQTSKSCHEIVKQYGGQVHQHTIPIYQNLREAGLNLETASGSKIKIVTNKSEEETLAMVMLYQANKKKHGSQLRRMDNEYILRNDNYPTKCYFCIEFSHQVDRGTRNRNNKANT